MVGLDLNRQWARPHRKLTPTIYAVKRLIANHRGEISFFLDFHGHSAERDAFMYGCKAEVPEDMEGEEDRKEREMSLEARSFPYLLGKHDEAFSYTKSSFSMGRSKRGTGRMVGFKEYGITNSYTLEASLAGSGSKSLDDAVIPGMQYGSKELERIGRSVGECLLKWVSSDQALLCDEIAQSIREMQGHDTLGGESKKEDEESDAGSDDEPCEGSLPPDELQARWVDMLNVKGGFKATKPCSRLKEVVNKTRRSIKTRTALRTALREREKEEILESISPPPMSPRSTPNQFHLTRLSTVCTPRQP